MNEALVENDNSNGVKRTVLPLTVDFVANHGYTAFEDVQRLLEAVWPLLYNHDPHSNFETVYNHDKKYIPNFWSRTWSKKIQ